MQTWIRRLALGLAVALALGSTACGHRSGPRGHHNAYLSHHHGPYNQGYYRYRHHYPHHAHSSSCGCRPAYHYY